MANVTGIDINPILQRLNDVEPYHPFDAETFSDWATEAGDMVEIVRDGVAYKSPVHTSRMVWKGKAPTMQISTTGNEKRDAVSRVSRKKYGRGSAGIRSQEGIHRNFVSEDGILHSELHITESYLRTEFHDETNSLRSYFDMTSSHMRTEFLDEVHSLRSEFEVTASHLRTEFEDDVNSLRSEFEITASHLRTEFIDETNSLRSEFEITASHLRTEFIDETNSLRSEFEITASHLRNEFIDETNSLRSEFEITASHLRNEFIDETNSLRSEFEITASHLRNEFIDETNSLRSEFEITASHMRNEFIDETNSLRSEFEITASHMRNEFIDETNSLRSEFEITASHMRNEFIDEVNSVRSYTEQTASSWETRVEGVVDANGKITAASITLAVNSAGSEARINANKIYLLGQTIADTITANYISTKVAEIPHLYTHHITTDGDLTLGGRLVLLGVNVTSLVSSVKSVRISDPVNNTYKLQYTTYDDDSWQDAGSFSRATTLSGAWSGRNFTVTASPQGNIKAGTVYETIVPDTSDSVVYNSSTKQLSRLYYVYSEDENGDADSVILHKTVSIPGDLAYAAGYTDGSSSGGSTSLTVTWGGGKITVTASPQGETIERLLQAGATTWSGDVATVPIESRWGNSGQYSDGVVFSPVVDASAKIEAGRNAGSANVTLLDPTWDAITGSTPDHRTVTVSTTGRKNASGTTENLSKSVALYLTQGNWSNNTKTVYMRQGSSTGTVYADIDVDASSVFYSGKAAVTLNDPTWNAVTGATPDYRTVTVSTAGRTNASGTTENLSKSVALYLTKGGWSSNKLYVSMRQGSTSGTVYAQTEVDASSIYSAGQTAAGLELDTTNKKVKRSLSSSVKEYSITATASISYDSSTHKYTAGAQSKAGNTNMQYNSTTGGTEAYDAGKTDGNTAAGVSASWSDNVYTVTRSANTAAKSITCTVTAGAAIAYDSSTHKYTATGTAYGNATSRRTATKTSGTEAYDAGKTDGNTAAGVSGSWSDNVYTVTRAANVANKSLTCTVTAGAAIAYNSTTHKYTATGTAYGNATARKTATKESGTEAYDAGWAAYYAKWKYPVAGTSDTMTVYWPGQTVNSAYDSISRSYKLSSDDNVAYLKYGNTVMAQLTHNKYTAGKNAVWNGVSISNTGGTTYTVQSGSGADKVIRIPFTTVVSSSGMSDKTKADYWQQAPTAVWHDAYVEGKANATHTIANFLTTSPNGASITVSGTTYTNSSRLYAKSGSGEDAKVIIVTGGSWTCDGKARTHNKYDYLQSAPSNIWHDAYVDGYDANHGMFIGYADETAVPGNVSINAGSSVEVWAYFKKKGGGNQWSSKYTFTAVGGSHSISLSTGNGNYKATTSIEDLADRMGVSSGSLTQIHGTLARNTWYGFSVSCGNQTKRYYFKTN